MKSGIEPKEGESMTAKEMVKLAEWLREKGHTDTEIIECLEHIAGKQPENEKAAK